jgi:hypothetical protein
MERRRGRIPSQNDFVDQLLSGVAEGWVTEIVPQTHGFRFFHVEAQALADRGGDRGDVEGMFDSGANVVVERGEKNLRLALEPPEGERVNDRRLVAKIRPPDVLLTLTQSLAILLF